MKRAMALLGVALFLSGCASVILAKLQRPPPPAPERNVWRDLTEDGTLK